MKILTILPILFVFVTNLSFAGTISTGYIFESKNFKKYNFDRKAIPSKEHLSIIWYILSNTGELKIHQMRGETKNVVYIKKSDKDDGYLEAVYGADEQLVTNSYNKGSYNYYYFKTEPVKHFLYDSLPWLELGNTRDDPTSFKERLYFYTYDLDIGIQTYIFKARSGDIPAIDFEKLGKDEKLVYQFFSYILFNDNYKIKLNEQNREKLKNESDYYWKYFGQIQDLLRLKD